MCNKNWLCRNICMGEYHSIINECDKIIRIVFLFMLHYTLGLHLATPMMKTTISTWNLWTHIIVQ